MLDPNPDLFVRPQSVGSNRAEMQNDDIQTQASQNDLLGFVTADPLGGRISTGPSSINQQESGLLSVTI